MFFFPCLSSLVICHGSQIAGASRSKISPRLVGEEGANSWRPKVASAWSSSRSEVIYFLGLCFDQRLLLVALDMWVLGWFGNRLFRSLISSIPCIRYKKGSAFPLSTFKYIIYIADFNPAQTQNISRISHPMGFHRHGWEIMRWTGGTKFVHRFINLPISQHIGYRRIASRWAPQCGWPSVSDQSCRWAKQFMCS